MKFLWLAILILCLQTVEITAQQQKWSELETQSIDFDNNCGRSLFSDADHVIKDEAQLRRAIAARSFACEKFEPPKIDFAKYTLVGTYFSTGNCGAGMLYQIKVVRDDERKIYRHIALYGDNPCRGMSSVVAATLVPRLPDGYKVVFAGINGMLEAHAKLNSKYGAATSKTAPFGVFTLRPNLEIAVEEKLESDGVKIRLAPIDKNKTIPNEAAIELLELLVSRENNRHFVQTATAECHNSAFNYFGSGSVILKSRCAGQTGNIEKILISFDLLEYSY